MAQTSSAGATGSPGLTAAKRSTIRPVDGSGNKLINTNHDGGVGDSGGGGGLWGGGGSSCGESRKGSGGWGGGWSSCGGSRRGSHNESLFANSSDTDPSESSYRTGAKLVASAFAGVEDDEDGMHAAGGGDNTLGLFEWGRDCSRAQGACDVEVDGVSAGDVGEPAMGRSKTSSRLTLFPGVDEGMGCIEEEPEQLDT